MKKLSETTDDEILLELLEQLKGDNKRLKEELRAKSRQGNVIKEQEHIEREIHFWEFLDIEYKNKTFYLNAHYTQRPQFPMLFEYLQGTPKIDMVGDAILRKGQRIYKQPWRAKEELNRLTPIENVIYYLMDSKKKEFYVGEAKELISRLTPRRPEISGWDFFRFDVLPQGTTTEIRKQIERMVIRSFASVLVSPKEIDCIKISNYKLKNSLIDK